MSASLTAAETQRKAKKLLDQVRMFYASSTTACAPNAAIATGSHALSVSTANAIRARWGQRRWGSSSPTWRGKARIKRGGHWQVMHLHYNPLDQESSTQPAQR